MRSVFASDRELIAAMLRGEEALFSWVCQICRREIADYLRNHRRYQENVVLIEDAPELRAALETAAPAADDPAHRTPYRLCLT